MRYLITVFLLFAIIAHGDDDVFELEKEAPKEDLVKFKVSTESLKSLLLSGDYDKLKESFEKLSDNDSDILEDLEIRKIKVSWLLQTGKYKKAHDFIKEKPFGDKEEHFYLTSEVLRLNGLYSEAIKLVQKGLEKYPEGASLLFAASNLSNLTGDSASESKYWSKIKSLYRKISKRGEDGERVGTAEQMAFVGLGARKRSPVTSYKLFQRAYKKDVNYLDAYVWAGFFCAEKYSWNFAIEEFGKALRINPNYALANAGLASVLMEKGDYTRARELIKKALEVNPYCTEAVQLEAALLTADEKNRQALSLLKDTLEVNPNNLEILAQTAAAYEQGSKPEKRDEFINKTLKVNANFSKLYIAIAQACENRRQFPAAVKWSRKAMETDSRDWEGYYVAGMNLLRLGEESEGYKLLDRAFKLNGFNIWARNILVLLDRDFKKKEYKKFETENFVIKIHRSESDILFPYLEQVVEEAWDKYTKRYDIKPVGPKEYDGKILLLMFHNHNDFSARTVGLPGLGALGACFGQIITMPSPIIGKDSDERKFNWKRVFEHEFVHVLTLQKSSYNIPRWFTEGISTWEEEDPQSELDRQLKWAWKNGKLLPLEDINTGFSQQSYPNQIGVSYYHASLVCKYINDKYGYEAIQKMLKLFREGKSNEEAIEGGTGRKMSEINKEVNSYLDVYISKIPLSVPMEKTVMDELESTMKSFGLKDDKKLDLASAYVQFGENEKATELVDVILKKDNNHPRANAIKGFLAYNDEDEKSAKEYLTKVLESNPVHYGANYLLAKIAADNDKKAEAAEHYENALKFYPRVADPSNNIYFTLAEIYEELDKKDKVLDVLKRHTEKNNKNFEGFVRYAGKLQEAGNNKEAVKAYMNANFIYPFDIDVHLACGELMVKEKMYKKASSEFEVALEIEPRSKEILTKIFNLSIILKDKEKAGNTLNLIKRFHPDSDIKELEKKLSGI